MLLRLRTAVVSVFWGWWWLRVDGTCDFNPTLYKLGINLILFLFLYFTDNVIIYDSFYFQPEYLRKGKRKE